MLWPASGRRKWTDFSWKMFNSLLSQSQTLKKSLDTAVVMTVILIYARESNNLCILRKKGLHLGYISTWWSRKLINVHKAVRWRRQIMPKSRWIVFMSIKLLRCWARLQPFVEEREPLPQVVCQLHDFCMKWIGYCSFGRPRSYVATWFMGNGYHSVFPKRERCSKRCNMVRSPSSG